MDFFSTLLHVVCVCVEIYISCGNKFLYIPFFTRSLHLSLSVKTIVLCVQNNK